MNDIAELRCVLSLSSDNVDSEINKHIDEIDSKYDEKIEELTRKHREEIERLRLEKEQRKVEEEKRLKAEAEKSLENKRLEAKKEILDKYSNVDAVISLVSNKESKFIDSIIDKYGLQDVGYEYVKNVIVSRLCAISENQTKDKVRKNSKEALKIINKYRGVDSFTADDFDFKCTGRSGSYRRRTISPDFSARLKGDEITYLCEKDMNAKFNKFSLYDIIIENAKFNRFDLDLSVVHEETLATLGVNIVGYKDNKDFPHWLYPVSDSVLEDSWGRIEGWSGTINVRYMINSTYFTALLLAIQGVLTYEERVKFEKFLYNRYLEFIGKKSNGQEINEFYFIVGYFVKKSNKIKKTSVLSVDANNRIYIESVNSADNVTKLTRSEIHNFIKYVLFKLYDESRVHDILRKVILAGAFDEVHQGIYSMSNGKNAVVLV